MNTVESGEYCRSRGPYPEQIQFWRLACEQAPTWAEERDQAIAQATKESQQRIRALERELRRKEKALAEAAALFVLAKKSRGDLGERGE